MGSLNVKRGNVQIDYGSFVLYNGVSKWTTSFESDSGYKISYGSNTRYVKVEPSGSLSVIDTVGSPRVHVRTEAPTAASFPGFESRNYSNAFGGFPVVELMQARGTYSAPTAVQAGDTLGGFNTWGYTGVGFKAASRFYTLSADNWTSTTGYAQGYLSLVDGVTEYPCARFTGSAGSSAIEVGNGRSGNAYAYLDLIGDTTYADYGLRIIRNNAGANSTSEIAHRGTGELYIRTLEAAAILVQTNSVTRGGWTSGGNFFMGSTTDTLTRTLGVTGIAQVTDRIRIGSASTSNIDATLNIEGANGGSGRTTQISGGASSLNLMYGNNWFSWGVDNNVWKICQGTSFNTSGLNMNISHEFGFGGVPVAGYKMYSYGNTYVKLDQNGVAASYIDNQSATALAQSLCQVTTNAGWVGLGKGSTQWANSAGTDWELMNGGGGYVGGTGPAFSVVGRAVGVTAVNILSGGSANTNIRARWSAAGNLALGYGDTTNATEKVQLKNGNIWLDGTAGTHGLIFPDASKQTTALGSYTTSFTNASLAAGILTVTHSLGSKFCVVQVYDNTDKVIIPDEITGTSTTVTTIDLSSFGVITGTWNVRVVK